MADITDVPKMNENENPDQEEGKERDAEEQEVVDITDDPPMDAKKSSVQKKGTGKVRLSQRGKTW